MGEIPDQDRDSAAAVDAFRHQDVDPDADTRARMGQVADATASAAEQVREDTNWPEP